RRPRRASRRSVLLGLREAEVVSRGLRAPACDELALAGAEDVVDVGRERDVERLRLGAPRLLGDRGDRHAREELPAEPLALARAVAADQEKAVVVLLRQRRAVEDDLTARGLLDRGEVHAVGEFEEVT